MDKTYDPQAIEQHWYPLWEQQNYFAPRGKGNPYCIMIPPPNVTGSLHMGHGFQHSIMDAYVRYHAMLGDNTLWQTGTDHAGIATQMVVEKQLQAQGQRRLDMSREDFEKKVWEWKQLSGNTITQQMRRLGDAMDWSRERFTLDEGLSNAVLEVFVRLHEEGLIYRGKRLVNWDPVLLTAISDLEVISTEEMGKLWHIRYPLANDQDFLIVATTRPETLLGDTAVAVHPEDERYKHLIGQHVRLPLTDRLIPIIADDYVDREFGSGCVKITPAHDFNDYAVGLRHQLPQINIFTPNAHINENAPLAYQGLERYAAREKILADLTAAELLEKIEDHKLNVPRGEKSDAVIEPYLTDQWFVKIAPLAQPAIDAVEKGEVKFIPENWSKIYFQWMNNIEDWCISRQLWWGHRIPAWYDEQNNIYVARSEQEVRSKYKLADTVKLTQDNDVLDTWFSSALWPFSTLGWPEQTLELKTFYPTSVLVTGFDIIFFWVARMIMMGLKFAGKVPFKEVYITGLIRDAEGQKMSKSKGNVLDPIDLIDGIDLESLVKKRTSNMMLPALAKKIEQATRKQFPDGIAAFGTDALRFTFCALATQGREIRFDIGRLEGYRNFCNKIWNAARYVMMQTENKDLSSNKKIFGLAERWITTRLQQTIQEAHHHFINYRLDLLVQSLYEFTWNEFCDWYLEFSKPNFFNENTDPAILQGTCHTLIHVLETLLRLMHPIMPFITEEIWQRIAPLAGKQSASIMLQAYPLSEAKACDPEAAANMEWIKTVILSVRAIRGEMVIAPGKQLTVLCRKGTALDQQRLDQNKILLMTLAKLESITFLNEGETIPPAATALVGELELLIPLAGIIDKNAEMTRLLKELGKLEKDLTGLQTKLANPSFSNNAPADVVTKERQRLQETEVTKQKLAEQLDKIKAL